MVTHNRWIFPVRSPEDVGGMTLLEYYAGQALVGLLSADHSSKELYPGPALLHEYRQHMKCPNTL